MSSCNCCFLTCTQISQEADQVVWSFMVPIFAWNIPLVSLIFLKKFLVFPILLFSFISLHWSLRKAFLFLLAILWNSAFKWVYLSFSPLLFPSLCFTAICKTSSDSRFAFLHFFFLGSWSLSPVQCHGPPSIVHQALCLSDLVPQIYFSLPLYNHKGIWFRSYLNGLVVFPTFFYLSLNLAVRSSCSEPQSAHGLVSDDCIKLLHLWLQRI